ncbi:hypothetical protein XCR_4140 [Xanthomonas campestris pv. raphani 756C]|nr:hypothetical protein XCR_4140 [Xanthomonas campestris pv. raphani 756C]
MWLRRYQRLTLLSKVAAVIRNSARLPASRARTRYVSVDDAAVMRRADTRHCSDLSASTSGA